METVEITNENPGITSSVQLDAALENKEAVISPFTYAEDEHYYFEDLGEIPKKPFFAFVKRAFDIIFSLFGIIIGVIPMIIIAIAIKATSKGGALYSQERLGLNGKKFKLVKFRTMVADAEKDGMQWSKGDDDVRITKVGNILRKTRMDELPQLFACLAGTLSIVGPRPERELFYEEFEHHVHGFSQRLKVKPGLTGLAQVNGGYDLRPEEKLVHDIEYIKNRSLLMDIKILLKTVAVVFSHDGAK